LIAERENLTPQTRSSPRNMILSRFQSLAIPIVCLPKLIVMLYSYLLFGIPRNFPTKILYVLLAFSILLRNKMKSFTKLMCLDRHMHSKFYTALEIKLTSLSKVLLEELVVAHLITKFHASYEN